MQSEDKKFCQKHKLKIKTIDLNQSTDDEDKYLCLKCLIERIDIQNIALVEETKTMIKQMKSEQMNNKIKENQRRLDNFRQIQLQVKELKVSIDNTLEKVSRNIQQQINLIEKEFEESESKTKLTSFEDDVKVLSRNYRGSFSLEIPKEFDMYIGDNSLIDSIQLQLKSIIKCPQFLQIIETLDQTKVEEEIKEVKQLQVLSKKEEDPTKTPSLKIQCNKHGKEIIMFNLNPEQTKLSRLACVECIQSNDPIKYTTINDAAFKWNECLGQTDQVQKFQNQRCIKQKQIIEILEERMKKQNSIIVETINKVRSQSLTYNLNQCNKFNSNIIFEMGVEQLNELTEILSQTDKFYALTEKHFKVEKEDLDQISGVSKNFGSLLQNDLIIAEQINNFLKEYTINYKIGEESKDENAQDDKIFSKQNQIGNLNLQLHQFNLYLDIFKAAFNQYDQVAKIINKLSNQFENEELQQFNQLKIKFEEDSSLIKKLFTYEKVQIELTMIKENEAKLRSLNQVLENELIEMEKRNQDNFQVISDLKKHDAEQIQLIKDLRNENQELSSKLKLVEQQKTIFEVQLKDNQANLQITQQNNQNNEQIIKQTQSSLLQQQQFSQSLTFSTIHKPSELAVTQNGKVIENKLNTWSCCMCDQMIPKNGLILFAIKIIEITYIMIGIGFRDIVQNNNYKDCYSIGKGTYNIHNHGWCFNHDQQDQNQKKLAFQFSRDDIIIVEVDIEKKYVKWTKQTTNEQFTLAIDASKDLYPCVYLWGNCKVEILNQVFN